MLALITIEIKVFCLTSPTYLKVRCVLLAGSNGFYTIAAASGIQGRNLSALLCLLLGCF